MSEEEYILKYLLSCLSYFPRSPVNNLANAPLHKWLLERAIEIAFYLEWKEI